MYKTFKTVQYIDGKAYESVEYRGRRTDPKPTDADDCAPFLEIDTSKIYFYDAEGAQWLEWGG